VNPYYPVNFMRWFNNFYSGVRRWFRRRASSMSRSTASFRQTISNVLFFPFRILFLPLKSLGLFHNTGVVLDREKKRLALVPDKNLIHRKLAMAYEKLGMDELALVHSKKITAKRDGK